MAIFICTHKFFLFIQFQRLLADVENRDRGFSGLNFFHIRRSFILTFIGTVTTYQLIVLQNMESKPPPQNVMKYCWTF